MKTIGESLAGKRFGLVLSAGFFGFYGHAGAVKALEQSGLRPAAYAGTSAGGLVASYAAAGASAAEIEELLLSQGRASFWDPDPLGAVMLRRSHGFTGLLRGEKFLRLLERTLPARRLEDCPSPLLLVATDLSTGAPEIFTDGPLAHRVRATCAYPGLFRAADVDGTPFWDGGLVDKAPVLALARSTIGRSLDAILVHYLPSRLRERITGPLAYAQAMDTAMATLRAEHFQLQLEVARQQLPVYVIVSELPAVSPRQMDAGKRALEEARTRVIAALNAPPAELRLR
jgi:NTE family protein